MNIDLEKLTADCPSCSWDWQEKKCALCHGKGHLPIAHGLRMYTRMDIDHAQEFLREATEACQNAMVRFAREHAEQREKQRAAAGGAA